MNEEITNKTTIGLKESYELSGLTNALKLWNYFRQQIYVNGFASTCSCKPFRKSETPSFKKHLFAEFGVWLNLEMIDMAITSCTVAWIADTF